MTDDELLLEAALKVMTDKFDQFITSCMDESGKPQAPPYRDLMSARGYLPPRSKNALTKARLAPQDKEKEG